MELFVYLWEYKYNNIFAHCLNDSAAGTTESSGAYVNQGQSRDCQLLLPAKYTLLHVQNYMPSCYVEGEMFPASRIIPAKIKRVNMTTSLNVCNKQAYHRAWFKNYKSMEDFAKHNSKKCFMHEIPVITMFLSFLNLDTVGWVKLDNFTIDDTEIVTVDFLHISAYKDKAPYSTPKIMAFDIEVYSSDTSMPKAYRPSDTIEMISVICGVEGNRKAEYLLHKCTKKLNVSTEIICTNELELIRKFFEIIGSENPDVITGYNIYGFDFNYIVERLQRMLTTIPNIGRGVDMTVTIIPVEWESSAYGANKYNKIIINGRVILDMYLYFKRTKLDKYSLEFVSQKFLGEGKADMTTKNMMEAFISQDYNILKKVAEYCMRDSRLVIMLFEKVYMWIDVCEVAKVTRCNIEDIYTRGEQMKVLSQCVKECINREIVLKPKVQHTQWYDYEGAYVVEPVKGLYKDCTLVDFRSLYPSIIIAYNICPSTHTQDTHDVISIGTNKFKTTEIGMFPSMIKNLLSERAAVKEMMSQCEKSSMIYTVLNRRQNALKVCANSVYGIMGFRKSKYFGNIACAESVTAVGRIALELVIKEIEGKHGLKVIYGDTDSCMIHMPTSLKGHSQDAIQLAQNICADITSQLPEPMALIFEAYYPSVILLSKKRYIMIDLNSNVQSKGVMSVRRNYCQFAKNMYTDLVRIISKAHLTELDVIFECVKYIDQKISDLQCGNYDIKHLVMSTAVKNLDSYKTNLPHVLLAKRLVHMGANIPPGTRLEYVYGLTSRSSSQKAGYLKTPEEPGDVDVMHYVRKQIISQIHDLLEVIDIDIKSYITNRFL